MYFRLCVCKSVFIQVQGTLPYGVPFHRVKVVIRKRVVYFGVESCQGVLAYIPI